MIFRSQELLTVIASGYQAKQSQALQPKSPDFTTEVTEGTEKG